MITEKDLVPILHGAPHGRKYWPPRVSRTLAGKLWYIVNWKNPTELN
jgi:hypothetical protein